ncbi:MAG: hypothetical protein AABX59_02640, partial [Nanoarchaeota archaeon]
KWEGDMENDLFEEGDFIMFKVDFKSNKGDYGFDIPSEFGVGTGYAKTRFFPGLDEVKIGRVYRGVITFISERATNSNIIHVIAQKELNLVERKRLLFVYEYMQSLRRDEEGEICPTHPFEIGHYTDLRYRHRN